MPGDKHTQSNAHDMITCSTCASSVFLLDYKNTQIQSYLTMQSCIKYIFNKEINYLYKIKEINIFSFLLQLWKPVMYSHKLQGHCYELQQCLEPPHGSSPSLPQRPPLMLGWECPAGQKVISAILFLARFKWLNMKKYIVCNEWQKKHGNSKSNLNSLG